MSALVGQLVIGWLLADLISGAIHWWQDRFGREHWRFVGDYVVKPNRLHHRDARAFTLGSPVDRGLGTWIVTAILGAAWLSIFGPSPALAAALLGGAVVNEVHRFAHQPSAAPGWLTALQETGWIQSPKHHAGHHRPPSDRRYCILTNWLNPLLDGLRIWDRCERALARVGATVDPNA